MALRLIEMAVSSDIGESVGEYVKDYNIIGIWRQDLNDGNVLVRVLLTAQDAEKVLDLFQKNYGSLDEFRTIVLSVEATVPREDSGGKPESEADKKEAESEKKAGSGRISRQELYENIAGAAKLSNVFIAMTLLSSVVATIGVLRDNIAIIIGAMVIAPLLGPNMALSLATTLGDSDLAWKSLKINAAGIGLAVGLATVVGLLVGVDPTGRELASRTVVGLGDPALALASGAAGALAFTSGIPTALVGVMVAVALLPPLVSIGLLLGSGHLTPAWGALLLFSTNFICINLSGVTTFWIQGIRPQDWWSADKARKSTRSAMLIWIALFVTLVVAIMFSKQH